MIHTSVCPENKTTLYRGLVGHYNSTDFFFVCPVKPARETWKEETPSPEFLGVFRIFHVRPSTSLSFLPQ